MAYKTTPSQEDQIVQRYQAGDTAKVLATEFKISDTQVRNVLRRHGVTPSHGCPAILPEVKSAVYEAYLSGSSTTEISESTGVSRGQVSQILRGAYGVALRPSVKRHLLTATQIEEGAKLYKEGADYRALATKYGVSTTCVADALRTLKSFKPRTGWAKYRTTPFQDRLGRHWRFKSSWELAYAKHLDAEGRDWAYEPRSYPLKKSVKYTPDFEVYEAGKLVDMVDVKGWLDDRTEARLLEFVAEYPEFPLRLVGIEELIALGLIDEYYSEHAMVERQSRFRQALAS